MSVAAHLGINVAEYDARIRTFIPAYEEMLDAAAALLPSDTRTIVDLGIGTGGLSARCLLVARRARVTGVDADPAMLAIAGRRLNGKVTMVQADFESASYPRCDAVVSSLALHHIPTRAAKLRVFRRVCRALKQDGLLINADCCPAHDPREASRQHLAWRDHLRASYSPKESAGYLRAWGREDFYQPLTVEMDLMRAAGLRVDVAWRRGAFAVVFGRKRRS